MRKAYKKKEKTTHYSFWSLEEEKNSGQPIRSSDVFRGRQFYFPNFSDFGKMLAGGPRFSARHFPSRVISDILIPADSRL